MLESPSLLSINLGFTRAFNGCKRVLLHSPQQLTFYEEGMMTIEMMLMAGDRRHSPYFLVVPQDKPAAQAPANGSFEDALRQALARAT